VLCDYVPSIHWAVMIPNIIRIVITNITQEIVLK
jgi:hypothetical protein